MFPGNNRSRHAWCATPARDRQKPTTADADRSVCIALAASGFPAAMRMLQTQLAGGSFLRPRRPRPNTIVLYHRATAAATPQAVPSLRRDQPMVTVPPLLPSADAYGLQSSDALASPAVGDLSDHSQL